MKKLRFFLLLLGLVATAILAYYSHYEVPSNRNYSADPYAEFKTTIERNDLVISNDLAFFAKKDAIKKILVLTCIDDPHPIQISDPVLVKGMVDNVTLEPKYGCACAHFYEVVFLTNLASRTFVFCDHCFDSCPGNGFQTYHMNPDLYTMLDGIIERAEKSKGTKKEN